MLSKLVLVAAVIFSGLSHAERPVRSLLEMRQENVIVQQWDNSCGAAALATVLTYYRNYPVTEQQVARELLRQTEPLRVRHRGGFSLLDMKRYASEIGFDSDGYSNMSLDDLAKQAPWIVPIRVRDYSHFVVVRKITDQAVYLADPSFGNVRMSPAAFARAWPGIGFTITARIQQQ